MPEYPIGKLFYRVTNSNSFMETTMEDLTLMFTNNEFPSSIKFTISEPNERSPAAVLLLLRKTNNNYQLVVNRRPINNNYAERIPIPNTGRQVISPDQIPRTLTFYYNYYMGYDGGAKAYSSRHKRRTYKKMKRRQRRSLSH
jgi:hypothetical protein